ncbi:response regulator [Consotaella aegiceratis]|uniref:response regulator n=1 Tax=Consotaella aegiceratis TaxID=3097961 RepID=UPI002F42AB04
MTPLAGITVFVVDDDEAVGESFAALLEIEGATVRSFSSAEEVRATPLDDDGCLLIDVDLGSESGLDLLAWLRTHGVRMPAVMMTGKLSPGLPAAAAQASATALLEKPLDSEDVARVIANCVAMSGRA